MAVTDFSWLRREIHCWIRIFRGLMQGASEGSACPAIGWSLSFAFYL
jgi:hypothetical protein